MEVVVANSEDEFCDLLSQIETRPEMWMGIHIHVAPLHEEAIQREGLSTRTLEKIRRVSNMMAQKLYSLGLKDVEGKIFVFEDSDVVSLFAADHPSIGDITARIEKEFRSNQLGHLFHCYSMKDKLSQLVLLSQEKKETAKDFKLKKRAVEISESLTKFNEPDNILTDQIQRKRKARSTGYILVIEDDIMARGFVTTALRKDYKVIQAKDAKSGIAAYIDSAPNMVLLDIHLPDDNGHNVLNKIKLIDPEAYVVMLSVDSVTDNVLEAQSKGAAGFIKKPFPKEKLFAYAQRCPSLGKNAVPNALGWEKVDNYVKGGDVILPVPGKKPDKPEML